MSMEINTPGRDNQEEGSEQSRHHAVNLKLRRSLRTVCGGVLELSRATDCMKCDITKCLTSEYSRAMLGDDAHRRIGLLNATYAELSAELAVIIGRDGDTAQAQEMLFELENLSRQIIMLLKLARNRIG